MDEQMLDPRETALHPRLCSVLVGHLEAQSLFMRSFHSGKMHHAWLISGPFGIGKATLAYRLAHHIIAQSAHNMGDVPQESIITRQIGARTHPDLFVLEPKFDVSEKKLKTKITIDDVRKLLGFFSLTAGTGGWRVALIDQADDLGREAADALLKLVEEPPPRALILLLCQHPGRLPRTLLSRCLSLPLKLLDDQDLAQVLDRLPLEQPHDFSPELIRLARGSPGRALKLWQSPVSNIFMKFVKKAEFSYGSFIEVADQITAKTFGVEDCQWFNLLLLEWIANQARHCTLEGADGQQSLRLAQAHSEITHSLARLESLNLDRRQTLIESLSHLQGLSTIRAET